MYFRNHKFNKTAGLYNGITIIFLIGVILLSSCSSAKLVSSWKNKEISTFQPQKLLVVGMTQNLTGRATFEEELSKAFIKHNINTYKSIEVIDASFSHTQQDKTQINKMVAKLSKDGFDAIVVSAVKGVEKIERYKPNYYNINYDWNRFGLYYHRFQDIYYSPRYYDKYEVYHIETAIYNINEKENRSLVWVGSFDVVDPQNITSTVKDYVAAIMKQLKYENLIVK